MKSLNEKEGEVKASLKRTEEFFLKGPETKWAKNEQFETEWKIKWRNEPLNVARFSEDLFLGVKCQTNLEIAGSVWKLFR